MARTALERLLDDNVRFDFGGRGTVNHLPMALVALSRLGASDERLIEYFDWWEANRALPRQENGRRVEGEWQRSVGDRSMFAALSDFFAEQILNRGSAEVLAAVYPVVARGVSAAAFHGLIRLAYGIEVDHGGEIAAGLAALCSRYADLGVTFDGRSSISVEAAFGRLADAINGSQFTGQGIIGRMIAAASDPRFQAAISVPPIRPGLLNEIAHASITLYRQRADFTVLHMVTASHAARILFSSFPSLATEAATQALWAAVCAAYASVGAPPLIEYPVKSETLPWREIFERAISSNDDHIIKMAYTCSREAEHYGDPVYPSRCDAVGDSRDGIIRGTKAKSPRTPAAVIFDISGFVHDRDRKRGSKGKGRCWP